jgi:hypothetical protein
VPLRSPRGRDLPVIQRARNCADRDRTFGLQGAEQGLQTARVIVGSGTLKFQEVEAGIGGMDFGFEYSEIQPTISASGAGESEPAWDFSTAAGAQVQGSKWMHLLLKVGTEMTACDASLQLTADVVRAGVRIPVFSRPKQTSADPLTVRLCG